MPTYSYACTQCDHRFDVVQSFSDDSLTVCPECQGRLRKVFNAVGVVFKGGGFYRTDSRSGSSSSVAPTSEGGKSDAGTSDSGKSDSAKSGAGSSSASSSSSGSTAKAADGSAA